MIYTGYYANMRKAPEGHDYKFVSISRGNPTWFTEPLADLNDLKPSWGMINLAKEHNYVEFVKAYQAQLDQISIRDVMDMLEDESIMLCFEGKDKFCHRHIARDWFRKYGILCKEITF